MEVIHVCLDSPILNKKMLLYGYPFCAHVVTDLYICYSLNFCGGALLKWYRDNFAQEIIEFAEKEGKDVYDVLVKSAENAHYPVLFLPYFEGSQTPMNDPDVEGSILGMNLRTKKEDIKSFEEDPEVYEHLNNFLSWIKLFNKLEIKYPNIIFYQKRLINNPDDKESKNKLIDLLNELSLE